MHLLIIIYKYYSRNLQASPMRRKDREMDAAFATDILRHAPYITVSMTDEDGMPYAVPLSLASADGKVYYFHCAAEGKKAECIKACPNVFLSAVTRCKPTVGPKDNSFTLEYKSATAKGIAEIVTDYDEKIEAMRIICQRFLPHHMEAFSQALAQSIDITTVMRITLTDTPIGKRKEYDENGDEKKYQRE